MWYNSYELFRVRGLCPLWFKVFSIVTVWCKKHIPLDRVHPSHEPIWNVKTFKVHVITSYSVVHPLSSAGDFLVVQQVVLLLMIVLYHNCLPMSSTFYNFFEKVLFTVLRIFLWIPEPLFELVDRLSLSTRLYYYGLHRMSTLFWKYFYLHVYKSPQTRINTGKIAWKKVFSWKITSY